MVECCVAYCCAFEAYLAGNVNNCLQVWILRFARRDAIRQVWIFRLSHRDAILQAGVINAKANNSRQTEDQAVAVTVRAGVCSGHAETTVGE